MKNAFKLVFKSSVAEPFIFGVMVVLFLQYLIFPFFKIHSSFKNLLIISISCGLLYFIIRYLYLKIFFDKEYEDEYSEIHEIETGTELDFNPKYVNQTNTKKSKSIKKKKL